MKVIILAGGSGTRLWPLSRRTQPKQFLKQFDGESLLRKAVRRALAVSEPAEIVIVTNLDYEFQVRNHVREENPDLINRIVLEPCARNTAPAIALGLCWLSANGSLNEEDAVLVMASDHLIHPESAFVDTAQQAARLASQGSIVTFGIPPIRPETGYGYIHHEQTAVDGGYRVRQFVEKPDSQTAERYLASGEYLWNSGMFAFTPAVMMAEMKRQMPDLAAAVSGGLDACLASFDEMPSVSIDYGIMEHADNVMVLPVSFHWSDVGSWDSFYDVLPKDASSNVVTGDVLPVDTQNCLILGNRRLIATVGLENMLLVETPDAILVARQGDAQKVKTVVETLQAEDRMEVEEHVTIDRPWGSYTVLDEMKGSKIKRIAVQPGEKLSLQLHHHRSEHWVVIRGEAKVTVGEQVSTVRKNESIFVPKQTRHRLENPGTELLEIVEVQVGEYVGEDDIVRFDDVYGRTPDQETN